ncbi:hemolysin family protein [Luteipulveratus sp. YIM 133132]|uniref:Hemolysin family protein n=1 Tax=Luteipulveratus flavus TaxID=3031728 RepID=A0ABT6C4L0_9MICO|nr:MULTISPECIES: hemolysin family protein [unclassified Luteipulveratus]MDE9364207.1 hemolysin family protein [Luteipulveratus sp. YIM 133132]MDF8263631.1 hemolysin family protein [Luteipulveratus sp. YIM 133296]
MSAGLALGVSVVLLVLNAFFVAAEFALIASRRHRLEDLATSGGRAARAAVDASRELTLMLAGAQLGITLCTLGLGAVAKPAVKDLLAPLLKTTGMPEAVAGGIALVLAVGIVVFLHMVVGEMAPKSWAISHPERSAILLALPFRAFSRGSRWALQALNGLANSIVRLLRVDPVETVADAHGPQELQLLLAQSHQHGALPEAEHTMLSGALRLEQTSLADVTRPWDQAVTVPYAASVAEASAVSRSTGRSRLVVVDDGTPVGLIHIRDLITADPGAALRPLVRPVERLRADLPLIDALEAMRGRRAHLALVADGEAVMGLIALEDLIEEVLGRFDDETDRAGAA